MATNPVKLMFASASVGAFSGTDADYSARDFILQCEDVMNNFSVTDDGHKIAFVRSHLQSGSRASHLMQASAFTEPHENKNYPEFRSNFLETFDVAEKYWLVRAMNSAATTVLANLGQRDIFVAQVIANQIATDLMKCLKDTGWMDGYMTYTNIKKYTELLLYMLILDGEIRKSTLFLEFRPRDTLHSFVQKLKTKIEEKEGVPYLFSDVAADQDKNAGANVSASSVAAACQGKAEHTCSYCQREGHSVSRCYQRIRDQRRQKSNATARKAM